MKDAHVEPDRLSDCEQRVWAKIKRITTRGNDAEVRAKKDGTLAVYEVKKRVV